MVEFTASPKKDHIVYSRIVGGRSSVPSTCDAQHMLMFVLGRIWLGALITDVNEDGITLTSWKEVAKLEGHPPDIFLILMLVRFCQRMFAGKRPVVDPSMDKHFERLIGDVRRLDIEIDEMNVAPFLLPDEAEALERVVAVMAVDNPDPADIERLYRQPWEWLFRAAEAFATKPKRFSTRMIINGGS